MIENCTIHHTAIIYHPDLCNLYGCQVGPRSTVGPFVEIQRGAVVGTQSKICSHTFICAGVTIGDRVFVGHGVMFVNDRYPVIVGNGLPESTSVGDDVAIGSGSTLLPVRVGHGAIVGAGSVVTKDVPPMSVVVGNPAQVIRVFGSLAERGAYVAQRDNLHPIS